MDMLTAVLSPCCRCMRYWTVVLLEGDRFLETRNVCAKDEDEALQALNNYVSRRYGETILKENITT